MGDSSDDSESGFEIIDCYWAPKVWCDGCERDIDMHEKVWRFKDNLPITTRGRIGFDLCTDCGPKRWLEGTTVEYEDCCGADARCLRCGASDPGEACKSAQLHLGGTVILFAVCDPCAQPWGAHPPLNRYMQMHKHNNCVSVQQ